RLADIRSDIYSAGCILYHCLTGQPPFVDASPVRLMVRQATEEPRPLRELAPEAPPGLQQILDWMLAKDPARRYPTPAPAAAALPPRPGRGAARGWASRRGPAGGPSQTAQRRPSPKWREGAPAAGPPSTPAAPPAPRPGANPDPRPAPAPPPPMVDVEPVKGA